MAVAIVHSRALSGVSAPHVTVEVHLAGGLPGVHIVGLAETEVREARDRVRAALQNAQFEFPARKVTVSLAPADLPKESGRFDLPIAIGILAASGQLPQAPLSEHEFAGELALTGELRAIRGALAMVLSARHDGRAFVLPQASAAEASLVRGATVLPAATLARRLRASDRRGAVVRGRVATAAIAAAGRCARSRRRSRTGHRPSACWKSPPRDFIRCCCWARRAPANRCSRTGCRRCCRR